MIKLLLLPSQELFDNNSGEYDFDNDGFRGAGSCCCLGGAHPADDEDDVDLLQQALEDAIVVIEADVALTATVLVAEAEMVLALLTGLPSC